MQNHGSRKAACGLVGRYLVDYRLTAGVHDFNKVPVTVRCHGCHLAWLEMSDQ